MLAKLAFRNVRRSIKDYGIYFVTLLFGVAVFYAFNSVQSQSILFDMKSTAAANIFDATGTMLSYFSVVIACVLGFLVLYANGFLVRRRKHEFGTYLMLGMTPRRVSAIILMETVAVGLLALVAGLVLGIALSQGMSFLTAGLFAMPMEKYQFVFSLDAFVLTLVCFAVIFAVTALFNTATIRRFKLIDLLNARAKNTKLRVRNPWVSLVAFLVAVALIAWSYVTLIEDGFFELLSPAFWQATALMLVGTFLLFWSLAGFTLAIIERTRGIYFKGLAMFTMRQIASKVNTAFVSLSVVCVMLFLSITTFSSGMGVARMLSGEIEESTLFDLTLTAWPNSFSDDDTDLQAEAKSYDWDMAAKIIDEAPQWDNVVKDSAQMDVYYSDDMVYQDFFEDSTIDFGMLEDISEQGVTMVPASQFNAVAQLIGRPTVDVGQDGYAVNNNVEFAQALSEEMAHVGRTIAIAGHNLEATGELRSMPTQSGAMLVDAAQVIVPDAVVSDLRARGYAPDLSYLNIMYAVERNEGDTRFAEVMSVVQPLADGATVSLASTSFEFEPWPVAMAFSAEEGVAQAGGINLMLSYLALYIGFVFLIATASILAIQQLSETSDSLPRYKVLAETGCDRAMIFGSLRTQVLVYFLVPLGVALCHTVCAVGVISGFLMAFGVSIAEPALMTGAFVVVVYGAYLAVAYFASKGIVRSFLGKKLAG